jgi:hypothetical protein
LNTPDPEPTAATYQPWLPDGSPEPHLNYDPAAAAAYLAGLDAEADDESAKQEWELEWDSEDSARYQDQLEAVEREAAAEACPEQEPEAC